MNKKHKSLIIITIFSCLIGVIVGEYSIAKRWEEAARKSANLTQKCIEQQKTMADECKKYLIGCKQVIEDLEKQ